ncbi:hypothetical protein U3516DRAFT_782060 [Neocallimastix sp. 'constans']
MKQSMLLLISQQQQHNKNKKTEGKSNNNKNHIKKKKLNEPLKFLYKEDDVYKDKENGESKVKIKLEFLKKLFFLKQLRANIYLISMKKLFSSLNLDNDSVINKIEQISEGIKSKFKNKINWSNKEVTNTSLGNFENEIELNLNINTNKNYYTYVLVFEVQGIIHSVYKKDKLRYLKNLIEINNKGNNIDDYISLIKDEQGYQNDSLSSPLDQNMCTNDKINNIGNNIDPLSDYNNPKENRIISLNKDEQGNQNDSFSSPLDQNMCTNDEINNEQKSSFDQTDYQLNNTLILEFNEVQCMDINTNTICQELNKLIFENKNQAPVMHMCNNLSNGTMNESNLINNQMSDKSLDSKLLIQSTSNPNLESSYLLTVHSETINDFSNFNPLNQSMSNPNLGNNCELMVPSRVHLLKSSINDTNLGNIHPMVNLKH